MRLRNTSFNWCYVDLSVFIAEAKRTLVSHKKTAWERPFFEIRRENHEPKDERKWVIATQTEDGRKRWKKTDAEPDGDLRLRPSAIG